MRLPYQPTVTKYWLVALLLVLFLIVVTGAKSAEPDTAIQVRGRYVMYSAQVSGTNPAGLIIQENVLLMLDSETGKVWEYQTTSATKQPDGGTLVIPSMLSHVLTENMDAGNPHDWILQSIQSSKQYIPKNR